MKSLALLAILAAGVAAQAARSAAEEAPAPADPPDSAIAVVDPTGGVAPIFYTAPQTRTVFFGHDRESFSEVGITKLSVLANAARLTGAGTVSVVGHTDTVGDVPYNFALSRRRAEAIRRDLIGRGVPSAAISTRALGQSELAVPTADGVQEPANRRVVVAVDGSGAFPAPDPDTPIRFRLP